MKKLIVFLPLLLVACAHNGAKPDPCDGWHLDDAACRRSVTNAAAIDQVRIGQSSDQVRAIMGAPERREATATSARWGYLTSYNSELVTTIVFDHGVVTAITTGPQHPATE